MISRIAFLFFPALFGWTAIEDPGVSIVWSLVGSLFVAAVAQTTWFRQVDDDAPITHRLLRPVSMYNLYFVGFHVVGGACYALEAAGYSLSGYEAKALQDDLALVAEAQRLMLLAHTGMIAGMKLVGLQYKRAKYIIPFIPPFGLIVISVFCFTLGSVISTIPTLHHLGQLILAISGTAIVLDIGLSVRRQHFVNGVLSLTLLGLHLVRQVLSGWKGLALYTMMMLGVLLYPLMPRRVIVGGLAFFLFWALFLHPFGLALRPLIWTQEIQQEEATSISMEHALNMSLEERLEGVWTLMTSRANELSQFQKYILQVPAVRPYYQFELVRESLIGAVPRILWPEKPDLEGFAMQRVYEAGVVFERSDVSAKSNFYQDAYLSGGGPAVVLACILLGMLIMFISHLCEQLFGGYDIGTCLIYTSLFGVAFNAPTNFLYFVGTIGTSIVTMFGLFNFGRIMGWIVPTRNFGQLRDEETA